ncbi:MAG: hypothetical protein Q9227_005657 [Pyrenula ochraceoflavens]
MIKSFKITNNETQIALYVGMLTSSFAFAEFSTGVIWGRISDRIGRKPVLIMGLIGTALSMILFGFSRNLPMALLARALGGLLNGNVAVLQTTVAELVTVKEHQPRAYSIMPFVWCLGSIIGPALGGLLAQPCEKYPLFFRHESLFRRYPFLLSNLVCVAILIFGIIVGVLFLEETHAKRKGHKDYGRKLGQKIITRLSGQPPVRTERHSEDLPEYCLDQPPEYKSRESSPRISTTSFPGNMESADVESSRPNKSQLGVRRTFSRQIILFIVGYGILAFHSVSFDQLMPVLLSQPKSYEKPSLPFKFSGGFALSSKAVGAMMAVQGFYSMIAQLWLFPWAVRRLGTLTTFRTVILVWPVLDFAVPYLLLLPERYQIAAVYFFLIAKITLHVIAFPSMTMLITNSAPSTLVLGTINGVAASTACLARAIGPTVTGFVHAVGLQHGYVGLAWWVMGLMCTLGAVESFWLEEPDTENISPQKEEDTSACEPLLHSITGETPDKDETSAFLVDELRRSSTDSIDSLDLSMVKA